MKKINYGSFVCEVSVDPDYMLLKHGLCDYERDTIAYAVERFFTRCRKAGKACTEESIQIRVAKGKAKRKHAFMYLAPAILMELPEGWGIEQEITCVDATTYQVYMANMKSLFMDMVRNTDMVIFNRCKEGDPLPAYRRGIKVANQSAEVIFEDEEGEMEDIFQDELPFDINAPIVEIPPEDYGIWFVDAMDNPDTYVEKIVRFKGRVMKPRGMGSKFFVPGRVAMTCCADDTTFLGYICRSDYAPHIKEGSWVEVTAKVAFENRTEYQGEGIVLYASDVKECEPLKEEMVYFN